MISLDSVACFMKMAFLEDFISICISPFFSFQALRIGYNPLGCLCFGFCSPLVMSQLNWDDKITLDACNAHSVLLLKMVLLVLYNVSETSSA